MDISMNKIAVILDIDGVIVDSEQLHFNTLIHVVPDHARDFKPEDLIGLSLDETLHVLRVKPEHVEKTKTDVHSAYQSLLSEAYIRPGIEELLRYLKHANIDYGYVSSAPRDICLLNLALVEKRIPLLIAGDDLPRTKPFPDPYLAMAAKLNTPVENIVVIEDSDVGICSARDAGIQKVYAWPHALSVRQHYRRAYRVIEKLSDIVEFNT